MANLTGKTIGQLALLTGITQDTLFAVELSGATYHIPYSGLSIGGGGSYEEVTYDELYTLYTGGTLTPGGYYLITDFQSIYDQPDYDVYGNTVVGDNTYKQSEVEPIVVLATSANTLSPDAYQLKYPLDKIKYDINFNQTEYTGGDAYGRITERIDEWNNRTDYDHRTILFKRYKTYFYDFNNPLAGTISAIGDSQITGGYLISVEGIDTDFENQLNVGDVIYVNGYWYKVFNIISATEMEVTGVFNNGFGGERYYLAESQNEGQLSQIPYTHTQMTDPPVDNNEEAQLSDFIMDGQVESGVNYFCQPSGSTEYFTNLYPGLFVMAAKDIEIDFFRIDGNIGADGDGDADINQYTTNINGNDYTAYIKRVYDSGDPSINQIFIVNGDGSGISQNYDSSTDDDYHEITNLVSAGVTELHYLLTSKGNSDKLEDAEFEALVDTYLGLVEGQNIGTTLTTLNSSYSTLTAIVPNLYLFNDVADIDDDGPGSIDDGGDDMYDGANYMYTNFSVKYRSYEWKNNNIIDDTYREMTTFRSAEELILNGNVTSINNWIGDYSNYYLNTNLSNSGFLLANNVFGFYSYSNKLGDRCFNNATYNWFNRNQISGTFQRNSIRRGFYANIIGEYFYNNIFNGQTWRNKFGEGFEDNVTGSYDVQNNVINNGFNQNHIALYSNFYKNFIGNGFNRNWIWSEFYGNHIGNAYNNNQIYTRFVENEILDKFQNNTIGDSEDINNFEFYNNIIGNYFKGNQCIGYFYSNHIGHDFVSNSTDEGFIHNVIGNNFFANNIAINFGFNTIGYNFSFNTIAEDFGYGGGEARGNRIGNDFQSNTIGEYFYDNLVMDNFEQNIIGDYCTYNQFYARFNDNSVKEQFQFNDIKYEIGSTDFLSATHVYLGYNTRILRSGNGTIYLEYLDGTTLTYVLPTA